MDAYYYRDMSPHYWTNGNGQDGGRVEQEQMTDEEIEAYILGYENEEDRKLFNNLILYYDFANLIL